MVVHFQEEAIKRLGNKIDATCHDLEVPNMFGNSYSLELVKSYGRTIAGRNLSDEEAVRVRNLTLLKQQQHMREIIQSLGEP